ncbi:MAG TPA: hypothetical protein VHF26_08270 [Trebonia sp.]|nr:hypothetical protein [Trebonia sp.]
MITVAAALPGTVGLALILDTAPGAATPTKADLGRWVLLFAILVAGATGFALRRRIPGSSLRASALVAGALLALAGGDALLARAAPFGLGLLSLALYTTPTATVTHALRRGQPKTLAVSTAVALLLPATLARPAAALQQHVAAEQWISAQGIPGRTSVQAIDLGMRQDTYTWDPAARQLTALFGVDDAGDPIWIAAETITPDGDPCGPVLLAEGDATDQQHPATCQALGDGLWKLTLPDSDDAAYARQAGLVTIALTGPPDMDRQLTAALRAAHQAGDTEVWAHIPHGPYSLLDALLL